MYMRNQFQRDRERTFIFGELRNGCPMVYKHKTDREKESVFNELANRSELQRFNEIFVQNNF